MSVQVLTDSKTRGYTVHQDPASFLRTASNIPPDIAAACAALGWTIVKVGAYGGASGFLVRDQYGITEPYSADAIL